MPRNFACGVANLFLQFATFNRLEDRQVLLRFVHYLNGDETVNFY